MNWKILGAAVILFGIILVIRIGPAGDDRGPSLVFEDGATLELEVLTTPEERARGLMGRRNLAEDAGVLFVFEEDGPHSFWMKDTYIPLDIIWFDSEFTVVHIEPEVHPTLEENPPVYTPPVPDRYVLEVKAGYVRDHGIEVGDRASVRGLD